VYLQNIRDDRKSISTRRVPPRYHRLNKRNWELSDHEKDGGDSWKILSDLQYDLVISVLFSHVICIFVAN